MCRTASLFFVLVAAPVCFADPIDSSVHIKRATDSGNDYGSGTVIASEGDKSLILTAAHVVPDDKGKLTVTLKGKEYEAKWKAGAKMKETVVGPMESVLEIDGPDLALIVVDAKLPAVLMAEKPVKEGARIHQWGFAGGKIENAPHYKQGKVIQSDDVWTTADARAGDSGCGLFNDNDLLVGVVHSRSSDPNKVGGLAVPLDQIKEFLKDKAKDWKTFNPNK